MPWRISSSSSTLTVVRSSTPQAFRIWTARPEKPHIGNCAVPFMNSTTRLALDEVVDALLNVAHGYGPGGMVCGLAAVIRQSRGPTPRRATAAMPAVRRASERVGDAELHHRRQAQVAHERRRGSAQPLKPRPSLTRCRAQRHHAESALKPQPPLARTGRCSRGRHRARSAGVDRRVAGCARARASRCWRRSTLKPAARGRRRGCSGTARCPSSSRWWRGSRRRSWLAAQASR